MLLARDPNHIEALLMRAEIREGDNETRLGQMARSDMTRPPNDPILPSELGAFYLRYGKPAVGVRWLYSALKRDPNHQASHQALYEHFQRTSDRERVEQHRVQLHPSIGAAIIGERGGSAPLWSRLGGLLWGESIMLPLLLRLVGLLIIVGGAYAAWCGFDADASVRSWENQIVSDQSEATRFGPGGGGPQPPQPPQPPAKEKQQADAPDKEEGKAKATESSAKADEKQKADASGKEEGKPKKAEDPAKEAGKQKMGPGRGMMGGRGMPPGMGPRQRSKEEIDASLTKAQQHVEEYKTARILWFAAALGGLTGGACLLLLPSSGKKKAPAP